MRVSVVLVVACLSLVGLSAASESEAAIKKSTSIPAQGLGPALQMLARDRDLQVLYRTEVVGEIRTAGAVGDLTIAEALTQLLSGTGLTFQYLDERTVTIVQSDAGPAQRQSEVNRSDGSKARDSERTQAASPGAEQGTRDGGTVRRAEEFAEGLALPTPEEVGRAIPEILVTGKKTLNMDIPRSRDGVQVYVIFDRKQLELAGSQNIEDFLRGRLTSASVPGTSAQSPGNGGSNTSSINLRGLGPEQTLILIDGHRVASPNGGGSPLQPDLNGIPLAAVERIEVLPTTASGIYGGGATGGVINVVLRRDYTGLETSLTYADSFDGGGGTRRIDVAGGTDLNDGKTTLMLAGSYEDSTSLRSSQREFLERGRAHSLANDPQGILGGFTPPVGGTTNICSANLFGLCTAVNPLFGLGAPVPLTLRNGAPIGSDITFVPTGYAGPSVDGGAGLAGTAGQYNLDPAASTQFGASDGQGLISTPTVKSLTMTLRHAFAPWIQAFADASASRNEGSLVGNFLNTSFFIPAGAPANPFQQDIMVSTPGLGARQLAVTSNDNQRVMAGLIFQLPHLWQAETDVSWNRTRTSKVNTSISLSADASTAIVNGVTESGAPFDIFRDTNEAPVDFGPYLLPPPLSPRTHLTLKSASARLAGPVGWSLPGGQPKLTFLLEHRQEKDGEIASIDPASTTVSYSSSQSTDSVYAETLLPFVSPQNGIGGLNLLELLIAARHDRYDLTGANSSISIPGVIDPTPVERSKRSLSSTDPTVGVRYSPVDDITLRATYATGFVPPALSLLVPGADFPGDGVSFGLSDPLRANEPLGPFTYGTGGNPNLRPEQSKSWSAGVVLKPRFVPGLRLSVDWIQITKHDNIFSFAPNQATINDEAHIPGFITRGPPSDGFDVGRIISFGAPYVNVARQKVESWDGALNYRLQTASAGTLDFSIAATRNMHSAYQVLPTLPVIESVGLFGTLPWQANATIGWDYRAWTVSWTTRFYDSYCLNAGCTEDLRTLSLGSVSVPSQTYHDVSIRYRFGESFAQSIFANTEIRLGIRNALDKEPPIDTGNTSYYSTYGDPRLASYFVTLEKSLF